MKEINKHIVVKQLNTYIIEKLKINKYSKPDDEHENIGFSKWKEYLKEIDLNYTDISSSTSEKYNIFIDNIEDPSFNICIDYNKDYYTLSSITLGKYEGTLKNKSEIFTDDFWHNGYDFVKDKKEDKKYKYLFTKHNANLLKEKLEYVLDIINKSI